MAIIDKNTSNSGSNVSAFDRTFGYANGRKKPGQANEPAAQDKPKTQLWLNIGYLVEHPDPRYQFVALPFGLPLDTMERKQIPDRGDAMFRLYLKNQNALLDQMIEASSMLAPGEDTIIPCEGTDLAIQIRRVAGAQEIPTDIEDPFARQLFAKAG